MRPQPAQPIRVPVGVEKTPLKGIPSRVAQAVKLSTSVRKRWSHSQCTCAKGSLMGGIKGCHAGEDESPHATRSTLAVRPSQTATTATNGIAERADDEKWCALASSLMSAGVESQG